MNVLLDTHILLWWLNNDESLTAEHRTILSSKDNICHISAASIWEISIKTRLGKLEIPANYVDELEESGSMSTRYLPASACTGY